MRNNLTNLLKNRSQGYYKADVLAASALREAIIKGALSPGEEIDEEMVAKNLNLSRTPVRQAIAILEAEGLVKRPIRKGAIVTELTRKDIEELYHIRAYLEGLAIKQAVPNYNEEHLKRLNDCLSQLEDGNGDANTYLDLNNRFHSLLYEPCEWDRLLQLVAQLRNNAARYMVLAREFIIKNSHSRVPHERILRVCESGNAEEAERIIRQHILAAMSILLQSFDEGLAKPNP